MKKKLYTSIISTWVNILSFMLNTHHIKLIKTYSKYDITSHLNYKVGFIVIFLVALPTPTQISSFAQDLRFANFETVSNVKNPQIQGLNRIAVDINKFPSNGLAILETTTNRVQPYFLRSVYELNNNTMSVIENSPVITYSGNLADRDFRTSTRFDFDKSKEYSYVVLKLEKSITTSNITYFLDSNVQYPKEIAIQAKDSSQKSEYSTVINRQENGSSNISFPETYADTFKIEFFHNQPLRIQEIEIGKPSNNILSTQVVWLGRPNEVYRVYSDAQKPTTVPTEENGNLETIDDTIIQTTFENTSKNPEFKELDSDNDGLVDKQDNCPSNKNIDQKDEDKNGKGDICEDKDGDAVLDGVDNCPPFANRNQIDIDKNSIGDVCEDRDNDKIPNEIDNCPDTFNEDQKDTDQDRIGEVCDKNGDSRWLQNNNFINSAALLFGFIVIGVLSYLTIRKK